MNQSQELTADEIDRLEAGMQCIVPGFELFNLERFMGAVHRAAEAHQDDESVKNEHGKVTIARLVRRVCTAPQPKQRDLRKGYGVPYVWWWIFFERKLLGLPDNDPWSESRWWLYDEVRGTGQCITMHGSQNCLAPETMVRMYDGSTKRADEVTVGDSLMGDNSTPRLVKSTCSGVAPMVKVTPKVGKPFLCTENHLLTVACKRPKKNNGGKSYSSNASPGGIYDTPISTMFRWGKTRFDNYGLISAVAPYPERDLPFDPYIYGLWLGDGTKSKAEITNQDPEVLAAWKEYFSSLGYKFSGTTKASKSGADTERVLVSHGIGKRKAPFCHFLASSINGSKFIRRDYLLASEQQRLELLAGIIDTDGTLNGTFFDLGCSDPLLMDGYEELANSLGFRTSRKQKTTNYRGKSGEFHICERLSICGDIGRIPVRIQRKKKPKPTQGRGVRKHGVTGFSLERIGPGKYAGFEVDGNHRFLLADYTVTHNSTKSSSIGRFAITQMAAWTADAVVYIASPHKLHGEDKSWQDTVGKWGDHLKTHYNPFCFDLGLRVNPRRHHLQISDDRGTADARFVSADQSSTIRGKKTRQHDESGMTGIMLVFVDEFVENPHLDLKGINSNASSNFNYLQILACNPDPQKAGHPNIRAFSYPLETINMDRSRHFRWRTAFGLCVRYAWRNSPNYILGRTRWPYLLNQIRVDRAKDKGASIVDTEVDAWCFGSGSSGAPLDEAQIRISGTLNSPDGGWVTPQKLCMFVDCAFGGRDPAIATILEGGTAMFRNVDEEGKPMVRQTLAVVAQVDLEVRAQFPVTSEWMQEMRELLAWSGGDWPQAASTAGVKVGDYLNGNYHCAYLVLKTGREYNVPPSHISFDSSQRGDITSIMLDWLGRRNVRWFYEGSRKLTDEESLKPAFYRWPYQYVTNDDNKEEPQLWSTYCSQTISMVWFFACEIIKRGWLSRGEMAKTGLDELCSRLIEVRRGVSEGRRDVYSKDKLKDHGMKSPAFGETLAFAIYFAVRFLGLIRLDEPKTEIHIAANAGPQVFIRGGHNRLPRSLSGRGRRRAS